jgi:3-deoxy-D-manno-octulosonic-acid transferase
VTSQKAAAHELTEAGAGVPVGSLEELEQAVRRFLAEPTELERRGRLAYEVAMRNHEQGQLTLQRAIGLVEALT